MAAAVQRTVLLAFVALSALWPMPLNGQSVPITIRLVNGKNGRPISDENLNVWFNENKDSHLFRPDANGIITLQLGSSDVLSLAGNIDVSCHPYNRGEHSLRRYSVSEILKRGVTDENLCNRKIQVEASPGTLVFYERPRTWLEWWLL